MIMVIIKNGQTWSPAQVEKITHYEKDGGCISASINQEG